MKCVRKKLTFLLLAFSSLQFPDQPVFASEFRFATVEKEATQNADLKEKASFFLSPQSVFYALGLLLVMGLCLFTAIDLVFKAVFVACTVGVYWATYNYSLHRPLTNTRTESVSIWVHGIGERSAVLRNVPSKTECATVYDLVSRVIGVPSQMLTLSTGVKILQRRLPLSAYTSCVDLSHGFSLHCCIRLLGGGSDDEDEGLSDPPMTKKQKLSDGERDKTKLGIQQNQKGIMQRKVKGRPLSISNLIRRPQTLSGFPDFTWLRRLSEPHAQTVSPQCFKFGSLLLNGDTTDSQVVAAFEKAYQRNPKTGMLQILVEWLKGKGLMPVSWETLIKTLRDTGLNALADQIKLAIAVDDDGESQSSKLLEEAMKEGYVKVSIVKVIIVGPAGVGKTCLYYLLLSKPPPKDRTSTECAQRPIRVIQVGAKEDGKWEEVELKDLIAETVPILCKRLKIDPKTQAEDREDEGSAGDSAEGEGSALKHAEIIKSHFDFVLETVFGDLDWRVKKQSFSPVSVDETKVSPIEKQAIYITDSGGQQSFWDLVPVFMHGNSSTLFVHRLCDKLDDYPLNELFKDGQCVGSKQRATLTTAQALEMMCQNLQTDHKSKVLVIGTHRDETCAGESIDQKNERLKSVMPSELQVFCDESMSRVIFEVNTKDPEERDKRVARLIREKAEKLSMAERIPILWYTLQIILEKVTALMGRRVAVLKISECEEIAARLAIDEDELKAALEFFDKLNIFFYKEHILPGVVFTSSQVPLSAVSQLVKKRYHLLAAKNKPMSDDRDSDKPIDGMWLDFRDQAKVSLEHLQDETLKDFYIDDIFTANEFLELLKGLLVVAPLSRATYFCPSLLEMVKVDEVLKDEATVKRVVYFPGGCAPPGVFCCAVCHLISKEHWEVLHEGEVLARNQVTFAVDGTKVTFVDKFKFFAVCINEADIDSRDCKQVNDSVFKAIKAALNTTHKEATLFEFGFLCSCTEYDIPHHAAVKQHTENLICSQKKLQLECGRMTEKQKIWHNAAATAEPDYRILVNKVAPRVASEMARLALALGLEDYEIDIITIDSPNDVCKQVRKVFQKWKSKYPERYTWKVLLDGLETVGLKRLANELGEYHQ